MTVFEATGSHAFIIGTSVAGIFWGVVNALFIRNVKIDESAILEQLNN
jgi:hypothetical protein